SLPWHSPGGRVAQGKEPAAPRPEARLLAAAHLSVPGERRALAPTRGMSVSTLPPVDRLPPDARPLWARIGVAFRELSACMRARREGSPATATGYHCRLAEALAKVGEALRAVGLDWYPIDAWSPGTLHGRYARSLLQVTRGPTAENVARQLVQ